MLGLWSPDFPSYIWCYSINARLIVLHFISLVIRPIGFLPSTLVRTLRLLVRVMSASFLQSQHTLVRWTRLYWFAKAFCPFCHWPGIDELLWLVFVTPCCLAFLDCSCIHIRLAATGTHKDLKLKRLSPEAFGLEQTLLNKSDSYLNLATNFQFETWLEKL